MSEPTIQADHARPRPVAEPSRIEILQWPAEDDRRRLLALLAEPRLLVVARNTPPPPALDDMEICVPEGIDPRVIASGLASLQEAVRPTDAARPADASPVLDDDGLLWFRGRWVAVSERQMGVVDLLVENYQQLVHNDDLNRSYKDSGGSDSPGSFRTLMGRIAQRLASIGLALRVVRRRGVVLMPADDG